MSDGKLKPSFDEFDESGREARALGWSLFGLDSGSRLIGEGRTTGSICQGETHSGRGMEESLSQLTWMRRNY
jgi:hypothetical protein